MGCILDSIKALFTKNTTNAASVSGARVAIMSADGTPIGNDSLANLASVLGGTTPGRHFVVIAEGNLGSGGNYPVTYGTHIKISSYYAIHLFMDSTGAHLWIGVSSRYNDYPNAWNQII